MAKKEAAPLVGILSITRRNAVLDIAGKLVDQNEQFVVLDVKRPRTAKYDRNVIPMASVQEMHLSAEGDSYVSYLGETVNEYPDVTLDVITETGVFSGSYTSGDDEVAVIAAAGTFTFILPDVAGAEEKPKPSGKAPAKPAAKAKPAPEPEEEEEEAEEEEEEFVPEEGSYVTVTDEAEEEVTGEVTALSTKSITVTDADEEDHVFKLAKVTVVEATRPKTKKKPAAKEEKPAKKPAAKGKQDDDDNWDND